MPIHERPGDLFESPEPALAHGCNCAGAMGKGIAVEFRRRWPDMFDHYRQLCHDRQFDLGDVFTWTAPDKVIFNLGTQQTWRTRASPEAVRTAIETMVGKAHERDIAAIAMPRIAAGLGGLGWPEVRAILDQTIPDILTVVVYSPTS